MRRIVILGKTGSGKSSVANTIFEEDKFTVCHGSVSAESPCEAKTKSLNGKEITLIDTPGLFDTNKPEEALKPEIVKCITECSPGPHAFLIVVQLGRFTEQENDIVNKITQYFSEEVFRFATVVFTHGDDLREGQKITEYLSPNVLLDELVKKCGGRCHVIDNKYWKNPSGDPYRSNAYQVKEILKSVEEIVKANNGNCYTNKMLQKVEKLKQQEKQRIAQSSRNLSEREIDEKAKSRVCDILNKAAGITTGVLLGALFGVVAAIGAVVAGIKIAADLQGIIAGHAAGVTAGTAAGVTAGTAAGVTAGTAAGVTAGTAAGVTAGTAAGVTAGTAAGVTAGTAAGVTAGTAAGVTAGTAAEVAAGTAAGVTAGTAAEVTAGTAAGATAGTAAGATAGTAFFTAGSVLLGTVAAAGAAFGAYKGYQAAEEAETPWEAVKKTAEALCSSGKDAINQVEEFSTKCQETWIKK